MSAAPRVFVSHSSKDKAFSSRLAADLLARNVSIWLDELELKPGDSIPEAISIGLKDTDYLLIVLSRASVTSRWVQQELDAAMMRNAVVLPVLLEDCEVPPLLSARKFADFRADYDSGLNNLLRVFEQESSSAESLAGPAASIGSDCTARLAAMRLADLRRLVTTRLDQTEVAAVWYDLFEEKIDDQVSKRTKVECVIELIERARARNRLPEVLEHLCRDRPDLLNP